MTTAERAQPTHFDSQYHPTRMHPFVGGGAIKVVDIHPERLDSHKPRPILVAPGWSTDLAASKGQIRSLTRQGNRVISLTHMRHGGEVHMAYEELAERIENRLTSHYSGSEVTNRLEALKGRFYFLLQNFSQESLRRALTLLSIIEMKGIAKADVVAHSAGFIDTVVAKLLCPDKIGNIVGVDPAGMIGKDSRGRVSKGNMKQAQLEGKVTGQLPYEPTANEEQEAEFAVRREQMSNDRVSPLRGFGNVVGYVARNPVRAINEVSAIAQAIDSLSKAARAAGSRVTIIHGVDDPVFPIDLMYSRGKVTIDNIDADGRFVARGTVDGFVGIKGHHGSLFADHRVMELADSLLKEMEDKGQAYDRDVILPE